MTMIYGSLSNKKVNLRSLHPTTFLLQYIDKQRPSDFPPDLKKEAPPYKITFTNPIFLQSGGFFFNHEYVCHWEWDFFPIMNKYESPGTTHSYLNFPAIFLSIQMSHSGKIITLTPREFELALLMCIWLHFQGRQG